MVSDMRRAVYQALILAENRPALFANDRQKRQGAIVSETHFIGFLKDFRVTRCFPKGSQDTVRDYFVREIDKIGRKPVLATPENIEGIAKYICKQRWSTRGGVPRSAVSKIMFFIFPDQLAPLDLFAKKGLHRLNVPLDGNSYMDFMNAFDLAMDLHQERLEHECNYSGARDLARYIGVRKELLSQNIFKRKVFDNFLMISGGR